MGLKGIIMHKYLRILGDGQIWDLKGILPNAPQETFEELFSGRALARMAQEVNRQAQPVMRVFSRFKQNGKITGLSVTRALLSKDKRPLVELKTPSQSGLMLHGMVESLLYLDGETPLVVAGFNRDKASVFSMTNSSEN